MSRFDALLNNEAEYVAELIYATDINPIASSPEEIARAIGLNTTQLICALGFRRNLTDLLDIILSLGFDSSDDLIKQRNRLFVSDSFQFLKLKEVKLIQQRLLAETNHSSAYQAKILLKRAELLEKRIESTVKPSLIENYRQEMRALYHHENLPIEFVEQRLENVANGFRALLDEINLIVDAGIYPADTLLHRHDVLPQEKHRLIKRGLIEQQEIKQRLQSDQLSEQERELLEQSLHEEN